MAVCVPLFELFRRERGNQLTKQRRADQWNGASKGNSNGLGTYSEGKEMAIEDLPDWTAHEIKSELGVTWGRRRCVLAEADLSSFIAYPMVWTNPKTGEKSLQVHSVVR